MEGKKTRGKQKREMKKIDNDRDLLITFTKRKSGINKKANELSTLTGAKVDILMFSPAGNSFSFGDPSLQSMTRTSLDERHHSEGGIYNQLLEDQNRMEIQQLNEKHDALVDQLYAEKAREKALEKSLKTRNNSGWWEANLQDLGYEQAKGMEVSFEELEKNLIDELSIRSGVNVSHDLAPMDQLGGNGVNSYPTYACGSDISEVVFGSKGIGASESILPHFSFGPKNEEQTFNLIGSDEQRGDLFDVVYPPNNQALGASFVHDDANGNGKSSLNSLPTNQTPGLNLTDASGSGGHALAFPPSNQYQGVHPFVYNAGNENAGGSVGHAFVFPPSNQHEEADPFLFNAIDENGGFPFPFPLVNGYGHGYF